MTHVVLQLVLFLQVGATQELAVQTQQVAAEVVALREDALAVAERYTQAEGENRDILRAQLVRRGDALGRALEQLVSNISRLESQGADTSSFEPVARQTLDTVSRFIIEDLERNLADLEDLSSQRDEVTNDEALALEQQVTQRNQRISRLLNSLSRVAGLKSQLSVDATDELRELDRVLTERADALAGEAEILLARRTELNGTLARSTDDSEQATLRASLSLSRERLHSVTTSLQATVDLMNQRDMVTTNYQEVLIRATGNVTAAILDTGVAVTLAGNALTSAREWIIARAPELFFKLLIFALIVFVFRLLARMVQRVVSRAMTRAQPSVPVLLKDMAVSMSSKLVFVLGLLVALSQLGIEIGPFIAGLGVAGFIVGFALQETLSNFAAGMMLLFYHPFDVGDVVEVAGISGTVGSMSVVSTTIMTFDNQKLVVPNSKIWGDVIRNKSAETTRRVDMVFGISYEDDVEQARRILTEIVTSHPAVLAEPEPMIHLHELGESSVNFIVRPWVQTADYWRVYWDVQWAVKTRFDQEGVSIPYPQRDVHLIPPEASGKPDEDEELKASGTAGAPPKSL